MTIPGKTLWPIRPERGGITTSARPGRAIEQRPFALTSRLAEREVFVGSERAGCLGVAPQQQMVPFGDDGPAQRASGFTFLYSDELQFGVVGELDRGHRHTDEW